MDFMEIVNLITGLLSGVSLFIFGMNEMSQSLTQIAGGKLSSVIERITENRYKGWLFGTMLSVFVQSSVTTVMVVGLVNSGIMKVSQATGVMIGANLGTTATAWLLSLNSLGGSVWLQLLKPSTFTPFLAMGGIVYLMFAKTDKKKSAGTIVVGFSVMMIGMALMSDAVAPLQDVPSFNEMLFKFSNPILGVIVGILCTLLIQSSAAAIGILQALAMSVGVTYGMAIPIVCGAQLGTCLTAILASLGSNNRGKRAALLHLTYNVVRNVLFLSIFYALNAVIGFPILKQETGAVGIAAFHTLINLLGSAIFLPLANVLVKIVTRLIPFNEKELQEKADTLTILNPLFLSNPAFAIDQVKTATGMLAEVVQDYYDEYLTLLPTDTPNMENKTALLGQRATRYGQQLRKYCVDISGQRMQDEDARMLTFLQSTVNDYMEICDRITGMTRSLDAFKKKEGHFSEEAEKDLQVFGEAAQDILEVTVHDYEYQNNRLASTIQVYREIITDINGKISNRNVRRLHMGSCSPESSLTFSELCEAIGKIIDRCDSIATHILIQSKEEKAPALSKEQYEAIRNLFRDKYVVLDDGNAD